MASSTVVLAVFGGALAAMKNAHEITGAQAAEHGGYQGGGYNKYGGGYGGGYGGYDYKVLKPYPQYANKFYGGKYYGDYGYECGTNYPQYKWYKPFTWKFSKYSKTGYYVDCPRHHKHHKHHDVEEPHEEPAKCANKLPGIGNYKFFSDMAFTTDVPKDAFTTSEVVVGPFSAGFSSTTSNTPFTLSGAAFDIQFGNLWCAWDLSNLREAKCTGDTPDDCEVLAKVTFGKLDSDCVAQQLSLQLVQSADLGAHRTSDFEPCKARAFAGKYKNKGEAINIETILSGLPVSTTTTGTLVPPEPTPSTSTSSTSSSSSSP
eukprot:CAMPEP_0198709188 /NCGR_PEP_ID=MMETSP1471-20131121/1576_1 /TAXON_ID=41880 /ORGANISM="Pycnococcus provasolii, Strain RCC733" /LENGTH=316 /DNA_ID=CAMNT_0044468515 /DNA_START=52 /DNA_END=1002 /DNA_ORIENTATION=+